MENVYVLGGLRSYIGVVNGMYRHVPAEKLGAAVLKKLLAKYPVKADYIICGNGVKYLLLLLMYNVAVV